VWLHLCGCHYIYVFMIAFVCLSFYACPSVYVCALVILCMSLWLYLCVFMFVCVCVCVWLYMCLFMCQLLCIYQCKCVCTCLCIIYIFIHVSVFYECVYANLLNINPIFLFLQIYNHSIDTSHNQHGISNHCKSFIIFTYNSLSSHKHCEMLGIEMLTNVTIIQNAWWSLSILVRALPNAWQPPCVLVYTMFNV
jgi:nuclear pore complex protein Nup62